MADVQDTVVEQDQQQAAQQAAAEKGGDDTQRSRRADGDEILGEPGKKALVAERAARKKADKENAELRARIEKFEDAQRTDEERRALEVQRLRTKAETAEQRSQQLEHKLLAARVAREVGLPAEMEDRLRGDSEDELRADAEALKELFGGRTRGFPRVPEAGAAHEPQKSTSDLFASAFKQAFDNA